MTKPSVSKICNKCGEDKPVAEFHKRKSARDGLQYRCKPCARIANASLKVSNPARTRASKAKYYADNGGRMRAASAKYYADNVGKLRASGAAWYAANREKSRIYKQNRRVKKKEVGGNLSPDLAAKLFKLQKGKCVCCGLPLGNDYHLDHIMPLKLGGTNTDDNMQLLRATCNMQKQAKHPVDFMQQRGFLI